MELVAEVEYAFTMSNLGADSTLLGILSIVTKIGVKNIQLADALYKMFSDGTLTYSGAALQRATENWMHRQASAREALGQGNH